jgi:hypothetical protein
MTTKTSIRGNKPKTNVETGLYAGRKSFGGKDGLGKCVESQVNQFDEDKHAANYDNEVKSDWRRGDDVGGKGGIPGVTDKPLFDNDKTRAGNAKPISTGGSDTQKSPFSGASKATAAESDWSADYKPNKV